MISVIVPAYDAEETVGLCLDALASQTVCRDAYEIIVVDDGSTDGTLSVAAGHDVVVLHQAHAGPAVGRNLGAGEARGDLLLFTDADCVPAPDWIEQLAGAFADPQVVGAKGAYRTHQKALVARFVQLEYEERYARMLPLPQIDFVDTYSAAYRRDVFLENGGFDARFPTASVEDQELSFRLAAQGYRLVFVPEAVAYHTHDCRLGEYWRRKFNIGFWKALLLRWHPGRALRDSHTPQVLKVQMLLMALLCVALLIAPWWRGTILGGAAILAMLVVSSLPLVGRALRRDTWLAVVVPAFVLVRALALGLGLAVGFIRFHRGLDEPRSYGRRDWPGPKR